MRRLDRPAYPDLLTSSSREAEDLRPALDLVRSGGEPGRLAVAAGLAQLLARHSGSEDGVLVLVDDAQWLDGPAPDVLPPPLNP